MFVRVDVPKIESTVEGFSYANNDGDLEYVTVDNGTAAVITDATGDTVTIYAEDVLKPIKALQAAYDHIQKGK